MRCPEPLGNISLFVLGIISRADGSILIGDRP